MTRTILFAALGLALAGCAATRVSESGIAPVNAERVAKYRAGVEYAGNPDYLPRTIQADASASRRVVFRYAHDVAYDVPGDHPAQLFNPLLIAGMAKSSDRVVVQGALDVLKDGALVKRYEKKLELGKDKTLFSEGETLSEIRRKGLLLVRDAIDQMLDADDAFLRAQLADR